MTKKMVAPKSTATEPGMEPPVKRKPGRKKKALARLPFVGPNLTGQKIRNVPLKRIDLNDTMFRFRVTLAVKDLVKSIGKDGQQLPVLLRRKDDGRYQVISGFRRIAAIRQLRWTKVQAIVRDDLADNTEAARVSIIENEARQTYNNLDRAYAILAYRELGRSFAEIERLFNIGTRQRQRLQELTTMPEVLQSAVENGTVSATHAVRLMQYVRGNPQTDVKKWVDWIIEHKATLAELITAINKAIAMRKGLQPIEVFSVRQKAGRKVLQLHPVTIDSKLSSEERSLLVKELKSVLHFLEGL